APSPAPMAPGDAEALPADTIAAINRLIGDTFAAAKQLLDAHSLPATPAAAVQLATFLEGLEARVRFATLLAELAPGARFAADGSADGPMTRSFELHRHLLDLLSRFPAGSPVGDAVVKAFVDRPSR